MVPAAQAAALERLADSSTLGGTMPTRRMLIIVNPYATTMSVRLKQLVVYALQGRYEVEAVDTQRKGHATELCRDAALEGYDVVVAFGGDGTVNEAANGLAGTRTALVPLPGGATNVYCRMVGIPTDVVDATEHLLRLADHWEPRTVDLGRVNDRWFTFSAGAGLDATVVERVDRHPRLKARLGPWYYAQAATAVVPREVRRQRAEGRRRGRRRGARRASPCSCRTRSPTRTSAAARSRSRRARRSTRATSPRVVLARANALDLPTMAYRLLSKRAQVGRHRQAHAFDGLDGLRVRSSDDRPVPVQVDGDYIGEHEEAVFSVSPGALRVLA